ncbi:GGDEF domain-containing protein [Phytopseudomonas daroniae]|uniref:GGDEF domain-containing protein n=1 Tax=Phytopseudomonas daroniae TaxID=2487519 RepID=UPI00103841B0|nr:GGDEF domain-containing protein [Pseudomonas daroniae]TBU74528.1 hypothetical protein DNK10_14115 [Pseudomonas daroniae]
MPAQGSLRVASRLDRWINVVLIGISLGISLSFLLIVTDAYQTYRAHSQTRDQLAVLRSGLSAMEAVSIERGPTNGMLGGLDGSLQKLEQSRLLSDQRLDEFAAALATCLPCEAMPRDIDEVRRSLIVARERVDSVLGQPLDERTSQSRSEALLAMIDVATRILPLIDWLSRDMLRRTPQAGAPLYNAYWAAQLRESAGLLGSYLTVALAEQRPIDSIETERLQIVQGRIDQLQMQLSLGVDHLPKQFEGENQRDMQVAYARMQHDYFQQGMDYQRAVVSALNTDTAPSPATFAERYVPTMASILTLRDTALRLTEIELQRATQTALIRLSLVAGTALAVLLLLGAGLLWLKRQVLAPLLLGTRRMMALVHPDTTTYATSQSDRYSISDTLLELEQQLRQAQAVRLERDALITELKAHAETDHLTGLANRRAFDRLFKKPPPDRADAGLLTVIIFDVDHFKQVNDSYGHLVGDRLLQALAERCQAQMRGSEHIARIGGEEFAIHLWLNSAHTALLFAERLRRSIHETPFELGLEQPLQITASFGIAQAPATQAANADALIARADEALYRAKHNGRNRCELAQA